MANNELSSATLSTLRRAKDCLENAREKEALELLGAAPTGDALLDDARGVCLMRLGRARAALDLYRGLALENGSLNLKADLPTVLLANYATALLLEQNVEGCLTLLREVGDPGHPSVVRLRDAIARWRGGLGLWARIQFSVYGVAARPVVLDFAPGEITVPVVAPIRVA